MLLDGWQGAAPAVLDACAAPGGKTAHLLELCADARVTALEIDAVRSARIRDNLQRLGLQADVRVADAADLPGWWRGERYDAILLDAPCSVCPSVGCSSLASAATSSCGSAGFCSRAAGSTVFSVCSAFSA